MSFEVFWVVHEVCSQQNSQGSGYTRLARRRHEVGNQLGLQLSQIGRGWCPL